MVVEHVLEFGPLALEAGGPHVGDVEPNQIVVGAAVPRIAFAPVNGHQRPPINRSVSALAVADVPIARGDLRQRRQDEIAEQALDRNFANLLATPQESVALGIVALVREHRAQEGR